MESHNYLEGALHQKKKKNQNRIIFGHDHEIPGHMIHMESPMSLANHIQVYQYSTISDIIRMMFNKKLENFFCTHVKILFIL